MKRLQLDINPEMIQAPKWFSAVAEVQAMAMGYDVNWQNKTAKEIALDIRDNLGLKKMIRIGDTLIFTDDE